MDILWHSNSPLAPTGYGTQTALFCSKLAKKHKIAISCYYGLEGSPIAWEGIPLLPGLGGDFGNDYLGGHMKALFGDLRGAILITLMDVFVLEPKILAEMNSVCWTPVDHVPMTPKQIAFFENSQAIPLAMSRFGEEMLEDFGPIYVPHGVPTNVFRPRDGRETREKIGCPADAFVVGVVAMNKGPHRKALQQSLEAFARLRQRHENALLYLHTDVKGQVSQGLPLDALIGMLDIPPESVMISDQYRLYFSPFLEEEMARLYSCFDVLLNPSMGEGFGIPVAEAQAAGVGAIVTDFAASREVSASPWKVSGQRFFTPQASFQMLPDVDEIYECLEEAYSLDTNQRGQLARTVREHAMQYDADFVFQKHLEPALEEIQARIGDRPKALA